MLCSLQIAPGGWFCLLRQSLANSLPSSAHSWSVSNFFACSVVSVEQGCQRTVSSSDLLGAWNGGERVRTEGPAQVCHCLSGGSCHWCFCWWHLCCVWCPGREAALQSLAGCVGQLAAHSLTQKGEKQQQVNQCWCSVRALQPHPRFVIAELPPTHSAPSWCQRCWEPWAAAWFPDWVTAPEVSPSPAPVTQDFKQGQWDKAVSRACAELPAHGGPQCLYLLESQSLSGTEMKCYYRTSWVCVGVCGFGGFA